MKTRKNLVTIEIGQIENICFVIMPFDSLFQTQYERVIRPAIEEIGLKCVRGDEIYSKPNIMSDIWNSIRTARLLIAELTDKNANVFYEVGLAHAIGKPIILLTRNEDDVPFDLKSLRYRYYDVNDPFWGENLRDAIQSMARNVIEQSDLSTYLEGITADIDHIKIPERRNQPIQIVAPPENISGNWKASWKADEGIYDYKGVIYITQQDVMLSANMTITIKMPSGISIVQEVLVGTISEREVSLSGVSYTYIQQGSISGYSLDNFRLKLSEDGKRMEGDYYDLHLKGAAVFTKLETG